MFNTNDMKPALLVSTIIHSLKATREPHIAHQIPDRSHQDCVTISGSGKVSHEEKIEPIVDVDGLARSTFPTDDAQ
jgi:hypothetical protein